MDRSRNCQEKALRSGLLNATLERIQILKKLSGENAPPGHRQAFRPTSHHNANIGALNSNSFLQALSIQRSVVKLMIKKIL